MNIYDIARLTGVSPSTVSRVVNGKPGVGKKKRAIIEEAIRKYNYQPDEMARSLVMQSTRTIGILTDDLTSFRQNLSIAQLEHGVMSAGYYCFCEYIGEGEDAIANGVADLARKRVDGALLLGVRFRDHQTLRDAIERFLPEVPVVLVYQTECFDRENVYCVGADERSGFKHCVDRLYEAGRRHTALLIERGRAGRNHIRGYFEEAVAAYPDMTCVSVVDVAPDVRGGMTAMSRVLADHPETDAVMSTYDPVAIGTMYACADAGKSVPRDISVIGEDNSDRCEVCRPQLSSLDTMILDTANRSVSVLLSVLSGEEQPHAQVVEMDLHERESI